MPTVADYDIVSDTEIELDVKGIPIREFPLETPGIKVDVRAVLSLMLTNSSPSFHFTMSIFNPGNPVRSLFHEFRGDFGITGSSVRAFQKVISAGVLQPHGNRLRVEVTSGVGTFGDIVLWYQTNV